MINNSPQKFWRINFLTDLLFARFSFLKYDGHFIIQFYESLYVHVSKVMRGGELNKLLMERIIIIQVRGERIWERSSSGDIKILLYMLQSLWAVIEMTAMFTPRQNRFWPFHKIGIIWINCSGGSGHKSNFQVVPLNIYSNRIRITDNKIGTTENFFLE